MRKAAGLGPHRGRRGNGPSKKRHLIKKGFLTEGVACSIEQLGSQGRSYRAEEAVHE